MKPDEAASIWKPLLELGDRIEGARSELGRAEEDPSGSRRLRTRIRRYLGLLRRRIAGHAPRAQQSYAEYLLALFPGQRFEPEDISLLVIALQRYLSGSERWLRGREMLERACESSTERLASIARLAPSASLRRSGVLLVEGADGPAGSDPLELRYAISPAFLERAFAIAAPAAPEENRPEVPRSEVQLLSRIKELLDLCFLRSQRIFERDESRQPSSARDAETEALCQRVQRQESLLRRQLETSTPPFDSRLLAFRREHHLTWEEFLLVGFLLVSEVLHGEAYASVAQVTRLFATSEAGVWRQLRLFSRERPLIRDGILLLEEMIEERALSAEAALATWVVDKLSVGFLKEERIEADERIDFHVYLEELGDSAAFLRDLGPTECEDASGHSGDERTTRSGKRGADQAEPHSHGPGTGDARE
jgi:hypothetical protein